MATLQEYIKIYHPNKLNSTKIDSEDIRAVIQMGKIPSQRGGEGDDYHLDLKGFINLKTIRLSGNDLVSVCSLSGLEDCANLTDLEISDNNLTSIDFLNQLPNPEKLEKLVIHTNKIQPTNIEIFSRFVNLKQLRIGTTSSEISLRKDNWGNNNRNYKRNRLNQFYGSLKAYQPLTKLEYICIEATDIFEGLEYLPFSLAQASRSYKGLTKERLVECSPHGLDVKCKKIQDALRPYDYDLLAWQLAHPHKMYNARPELFFNSETKNQWLTALRDKVNKTQEKLKNIRENDPDKIKKISRLESKIRELKLIQNNISSHSLIDKLQRKELVKMEDKYTQTELVVELNKK